jgi:hypothetical protein
MDTDEIMKLGDEATEPHRDGLEEGQGFLEMTDDDEEFDDEEEAA